MRSVVTVLLAAFVSLAAASAAVAQPVVSWATQTSSTNVSPSGGVSALADGSSISVGYFRGAVTVGTGPGAVTLTSTGTQDCYVVKLDADGAVDWASQAGGVSASCAATAVSASADGSAIVTGEFSGSVAFGSTTLTATGTDGFVAKISAQGAWVWGAAIDGTGSSGAQGLGVGALADGSGVVTGYYRDTTTFGSGAGSITVSGNASHNWTFVAKVSATGTFAWVATGGGTANLTEGWGVNVLADGSSIITGRYGDAPTFGSGPGAITLPAAAAQDAFVAKVDAAGGWTWATQAGGTGNDRGRAASALADGSAIVVGDFRGPASFPTASSPIILPGSASTIDAFVARIDPSGDFVWATQAGDSVATDTAFGVSALASGAAVVTGYFRGSVAFGSTTLTTANNAEAFLAQVDPDGSFEWAVNPVGSSGSSDLGLGVSTTSGGAAIMVGRFNRSVTFGSTTLTSGTAGTQNSFFAKYALPATVPDAPGGVTAVAGDGKATVSWTAPSSDGGSAITSYTVTATPGGATCTTTATSCTVTGLTNGVRYTFTVTASNAQGVSAASAATNAVVPQGASAAESTSGQSSTQVAALAATLLPSRTRVVSGQALRIGIRARNTGSAAATSVTSCIRLPSNLAIVRRGSALRSGRTLCFRLGDIAAGAQQTRVITVRAASARTVTRTITGSAREAGKARVSATPRTVALRPRVVRPRVTG